MLQLQTETETETETRTETETDAAGATILPANQPSARAWSAGGQAYDRISRQIADAIEHAVDRLDPRPGERILDAATGTGWAARRVAARGARVTGVDIGAGVIEAAHELDPSGAIDFRVADVEALPFPDGSFDALISTFGAMFAANPERAASEMSRVVKPGGRLALATWAPYGHVYEMFRLIKSHAPNRVDGKPEPPSPFAWGGTARLVELFASAFDLGFEQGTSYYRDASGAAAWQAFSQGFGPVVSLLEKLDAVAAEYLRSDFENFHERFRTGAGILVPRDYVITVGQRRAH